MNKLLVLITLLFGTSNIAASPDSINIDTEKITVSGVSAGAQMAHQLHIAYPDLFSGVGMIAGGPYGCADGSLAVAMKRCMGNSDGDLPVSDMADAIRKAADDNLIAKTELLTNDPVWLFHGTLDKVVSLDVSNAVNKLYQEFIPSENILYVSGIAAAHNFPTRGHGSECNVSQAPFVGNCDFDAAGELLQHLNPGLRTPDTSVEPPVVAPVISVKLPEAEKAGLVKTAFIYAPQACTHGEQACALHLVLHGCAQSSAQIETAFIEQSGYLPWARENNIVLAFPQVMPAVSNPYACWDWWGYTGTDYRNRNGAQMKVLADWVRGLTE